ncbi:MAG: 2-oxoacid:acceptor oxidoreductase subunit alpha [candidate division KSB1 bacterium]|nr:2-oxoacid:acceptor oxidoreductase subunit alpha [candidate division KSB1 bacterium]
MAKEIRLWEGNHLVAEAAILAGCRFFAGYPITPSSEIAEYMAVRLPQVGGVFIQMEDEIASMGAVIGASLAGVKSMTATSGPGFSLKQENLGYACMAEIPVVVVDVMRGGPSTGLPTHPSQMDVMQARWGTHGDHWIIALAPAFIDEIFWATVRSFNLSEKFRVPVILLLDEILGHMHEGFRIPDPSEIEIVDRARPTVPPERYYPYDDTQGDVPPLAPFFSGYRFNVTGLNHDKAGFPTTNPEIIQRDMERQRRKIMGHLDEILWWAEHRLEDAEIAVVAYGSMGRSAHAAVDRARAMGIRAGLFRPISLWPFPEAEVARLAERVKAILVPEMNMGQLVFEVERVVAGRCPVIPINKVGGIPIDPPEILEAIRARV